MIPKVGSNDFIFLRVAQIYNLSVTNDKQIK